MDAAASCPPRPPSSELRASELLLAHCAALEAALELGRGRPTARTRLETALGPDMTRRLLFALSTRR